ncbi:MAG: hypothetical protein R6U61_05280 [Thermoplasmata archaeon]
MNIIGINDYLGSSEHLEALGEVIDDGDYDVFVFPGGITKGEKHREEMLSAEREGREPEKNKEELDLERKNKKREMENFLNFLIDIEIPTLLIPGRNDIPFRMYQLVLEEFEDYPFIHPLHLKFVKLGGLIFSGCGGKIGDRNQDFFELEVYKEDMMQRMTNLRTFSQEKILLFHNPPVYPGTEEPEEGSPYVNQIIQLVNPKIVFYGMIDPASGMKIIDDTVAINPGPFNEGNYVEVNTTTMKVDFKNLEE